jgi:serine/threonine protein kinase
VDEICDRFEGAWRARQRPRIEDYLANAPEAERPELLRWLLPLEIELRRDDDENPTADEYVVRFAAYIDVIVAIFQDTGRLADAEPLSPDSKSRAPLTAPAGDLPSSPSAPETVDEASQKRTKTNPAPLPSLPKYEILAEVGRGGMGVVYRARHKILGKHVAIKILLPSKSRERFLREAQLLATVSSPHVVAVHDFEVLPDQSSMLCMDWVEGQNLLEALQAHGNRLREDVALPWMRHVCEGMAAAADKGIIHRDLKPSNILIDTCGQARVADFGLARGPEPTGNLSRTGDVMGTPYYMAPEQAEDPRSVDTRADIYSFGAMFYHALTGRPPFEGETMFSILYKAKTEPLVSPKARRRDLSERVNDLLERCLAKSPADRFPSFAELLKHLRSSESSPWLVTEDEQLTAYLARYQSQRNSYLNEQQAWEQDLDVYTFPRGQVLRIRRGDIVAQRVEALVSSDTCYLEMNYGVSEAIRQAGGAVIQYEARSQTPVRPGRAVVTSGGNLPARLVFHGVTVGFIEAQFVRPSRDLIAEIMASCLYHADSHAVTSIAFPLLGTGAMGFPRDICLDTMFQFLARMFLRGLTSVREARIILFG